MYEHENPSIFANATRSPFTAGLSPQAFRDAKPTSEEAARLIARLLERLPEVCTIARSVGCSKTDAEDVVHTVVVKGYEGIQNGTIGNLEIWLPSVAYRAAIDILRTKLRHAAVSIDLIEKQPLARADVLTEVERNDLIAAVRKAIAQLPQRRQDLLIFCRLEGHTYAEAAARFGVSVNAVTGQLVAARRQLRVLLERQGTQLFDC